MDKVSLHFEQIPKQDGAPIVFMRERALFGDRRPDKNEWIKHTEMFESLAAQIDPTHLTGLQRVKGLWRIYVDNMEDKICLLAQGIILRGRSIPLLSTNPGRLDGENTLRIRVQDVPLSVDDGIISRTLILKELEVISLMREKLRINGKLVNCETGDRIVTIKASTLKEPLARFMSFAQFTGKVFHPGQDNNKKKLKCSKCLEEGHTFKSCLNDWKCTNCFEIGHKQDVCEADYSPVKTPLHPALHIHVTKMSTRLRLNRQTMTFLSRHHVTRQTKHVKYDEPKHNVKINHPWDNNRSLTT